MLTVPEAPRRTLYKYDLPESVAKKTGTSSITMVELTAGEEMMASRRASGDPIKLSYELAKQALVALNGKTLNETDGSKDTEWERLHPKVRNMVAKAFQELHSVNADEVDAFLKSRQTEV